MKRPKKQLPSAKLFGCTRCGARWSQSLQGLACPRCGDFRTGLVIYERTYAVTYYLEVATKGIYGCNVRCFGRIPFIPTHGMMICARPDDDYRRVDRVYWSQAAALEVFLEFEDKPVLKQLLKMGWEDADGLVGHPSASRLALAEALKREERISKAAQKAIDEIRSSPPSCSRRSARQKGARQ